MEEYPDGYVAHNLPLLFLSGLGESVTRVDGAGQTNAWKQGHGTRIASEIPPLSESQTAILQAEFLSADATSIPWSQENLAERSSPASFRITCVGRVGRAQRSNATISIDLMLWLRRTTSYRRVRLLRHPRRHHLRLREVRQSPIHTVPNSTPHCLPCRRLRRSSQTAC